MPGTCSGDYPSWPLGAAGGGGASEPAIQPSAALPRGGWEEVAALSVAAGSTPRRKKRELSQELTRRFALITDATTAAYG